MKNFLSKIKNKIKTKIFVTLFVLLFAIAITVPMVTNAWTWTGSIIDGLMSGITFLFEIVILPVASLILALSGLIMDKAIQFSLDTAYIFSLSPAIQLGWVIVRDFMNMFFIFILIYISIRTIVNGAGFKTKEMLTQVIIAALLINFSLYITRAVVDVSNIFGHWLYGGIENTLKASSYDYDKLVSLSDLISSRLGIIQWTTGGSKVVNSENTGTSFNNFGEGTMIIGAILRLSVISIAIYIFLYCSVLFISRSITILFLMVFSPIGFMGGVLPKIKDEATKWRNELTSAAIFPIAFLLMLYIALQFINSLGAVGLVGKAGEPSFIGVSLGQYFQYFIIIFLLKASLDTAKDNAGQLGKTLGDFAGTLGNIAVGAVMTGGVGATAWAGRRTIGSFASNLSNNEKLTNWASGKSGAILQMAGKTGIRASKFVAGSSFDIRGIKGVSDTTKKGLGIDIGKAQKGGFSEMLKNKIDTEKKYANTFGKKPEGIARRTAYAESIKTSILDKIRYGKFITDETAKKVQEDTNKVRAKLDKEKNEVALREVEEKNREVNKKLRTEIEEKEKEIQAEITKSPVNKTKILNLSGEKMILEGKLQNNINEEIELRKNIEIARQVEKEGGESKGDGDKK